MTGIAIDPADYLNARRHAIGDNAGPYSSEN
jgi:hypothetical protein